VYFFVAGFCCLFLLFTSFFSNNPLLSLYGLAKICECAFLALYFVRTIHYRFQLQQISFVFAISALFESLLAIVQYLNQGSLNGIFYFFGERSFTGVTPGIANANIGGTLILRPYATFSHPNVLAGYLLIAMVLVWSFCLPWRNRWIQGFSIFVLGISSIALLLTFSRVAILIWGLLVLFSLGKILLRTLKTVGTRIFALFVTIGGFACLGMVPLMHEVVLRFIQTSLLDESVTERTELLRASIIMIQRHPFFGVGLNNFLPALAPLQRPMPLGLYLQPVHNIFILVFSETGIIGFALFMGLFTATVQRIKSQPAVITGVSFVLLVIVLITGLLDHYWLTLQQGQLLFAIVIGMSWITLKKF